MDLNKMKIKKDEIIEIEIIEEEDIFWDLTTETENFITENIITHNSWAKPSKKSVSIGEYLPETIKEKVEIALMIDLSGSIGQEEYADFISEVIGICKAYQEKITMRIFSHDTECYDCGVIENGNMEKVINLQMKGGGGTSHLAGMKKIGEELEGCKAVIFFTDCYSDLESIKFEDYPFDKLFVVSKNGNSECLKGKECQIVELKE